MSRPSRLLGHSCLGQVIWPGLVLGVGLPALVLLMSAVVPIGVDYAHYFEPIGPRWLRGETAIYDASSPGFYNPPWTLLITLPFNVLTPSHGFTLLTLTSFALLAAAMKLLYPGPRLSLLALILALGSFPTFDLLQRGQIDAFAIFGLALAGWGLRRGRAWPCAAGLLLVSVKPGALWLAAGWVVWEVLRRPRRFWLRALAPPLGIGLLSLWVFGVDWPVRLVRAMAAYPPPQRAYRIDLATRLDLPLVATLAMAALALGIFVLWTRRRTEAPPINRGILVGSLTAPYLVSYNLAAVFVGPYGELWQRDRRLAVALYILSWTPLSRLFFGLRSVWLDLVFPAALLIALAWLDWRERPSGLRAGAPDDPGDATDVRSA